MKNFIVVGGSSGFGFKLTQNLIGESNVFVISRSHSKEVTELGAKHIVSDAKLIDQADLTSLPDEIHGLVYCPGSINLRPFTRLKPDDFREDFEQNVIGAIKTIQAVLPRIKKAKGGSIVLFSTVAAKLGMPFHSSIATSKAAIEGLAKSLAAELAQSDIRVNVIAPSLTDTALAQGLLSTPEKRDAAGKRHPLKRVGTPDDMAYMVETLLDDRSSWITGQVIGVDGGMGSLKL